MNATMSDRNHTTSLRIKVPTSHRDPAIAAKYGLTLDDLSEFDGFEDAELMDMIQTIYDDSTELVERAEAGRPCVGDAVKLRRMEAWAKKVYAEVMIRQTARQTRRRIYHHS